MTTIETPAATAPTTELVPVVFDLYRDIHKGIRTELFAVTTEAGRVDPGDGLGVAALADQVRSVVDFLVQHAEHEDGAIQPVLEQRLPALAATVAEDHERLEARMAELVALAAGALAATADARRGAIHRLYVELAAFTSVYLAHQDDEERVVMPALEAEIGVEAVIGIHGAIIGSIPPPELIRSLAIMFPAMNVDDRTELLGGMRAEAPPEAFAGVWNLVGSVLRPDEVAAIAGRLGLD